MYHLLFLILAYILVLLCPTNVLHVEFFNKIIDLYNTLDDTIIY